MNDEFTKRLREKLRVGEEIDFEAYADHATKSAVRVATVYADDVWNHIHTPRLQQGCVFPWKKTHEAWLIRPSELVVWTGKRGEGKSLILTQVAQSLMQQNQKILIASMEMPVQDTMERMSRIALGTDTPTREYHDEYFRWLENKLWIYDQTDAVPAKTIIGLCHYAIELGATHVILDSMMMVKFDARTGWEKLEQQAAFVRSLASLAKDSGLGIHLVAHMRKGDGQSKPSGDDVKGGGEIVDLASALYMISANKRKAEEAGKREPKPEIMEEPDLWIKCEKSRRGITGNKYGFWLHRTSLQALERDGNAQEMVLPFLQQKSFTPNSMEEADVFF